MLELSSLSHTWILDVDGTLVKHNGYKIDGYDTLLPGVKEFFASLPQQDMVILITARKQADIPALQAFLQRHGLHYNHLIAEAPVGERILINDDKPSGLNMSFAINKDRDNALDITYKINKDL